MGRKKYEKVKLLGSGSFGQAWLVVSKASGKQYVIKEIRFPSNTTSNSNSASAIRKEQEQFFNEITIIRACCHVNIIKYKECFISTLEDVGNGGAVDSCDKDVPGDTQVACIVMEYADAGDLHECIKKYREMKKSYVAEPQIRNWFVQICFALEYLHKKGILHRDLKTQNIFMTSNRLLKVGDFGISRTLTHDDDFATTSIGTPQYLSPEICQQKKYDYKSDIWGLGCVLYEMCALCHAFPGSELPLLIQNIVKCQYKPIPKIYSVHLSELVKVMLRPDPSRRPSVEQILKARVIREDIRSYMSHIQSLPEMMMNNDIDNMLMKNNRKGSTDSQQDSALPSSSCSEDTTTTVDDDKSC